MKKITHIVILLCTTIAYVAPVHADSLAVGFLGTGNLMDLSSALEIADVDLNEDTDMTPQDIATFESAGCWAIDLIDSASQIPLGIGIDCLVPLDGDPDSNGSGISLMALSFFVMESGTIVTQGFTSVRPFRDEIPPYGGIGDADGSVTHMTGSIPSDKSGVVGGTGTFADKVGAARVSGAVNLDDFPAQITFDCLWVVEVEDSLPPGLAKLEAEASLPPGQAKK